MEIHNHGNASRNHIQANQSSRSAGNVDRSNTDGQVDKSHPSKLTERLKGDARVRERLIVEVKAKFHAGEYSTRSAVEQAAQNIVE